MADKEGPQTPVPQRAHDPQALQNLPPLQNPNNPIISNAPQAPEAPYPLTPHMQPLNWSNLTQNI